MSADGMPSARAVADTGGLPLNNAAKPDLAAKGAEEGSPVRDDKVSVDEVATPLGLAKVFLAEEEVLSEGHLTEPVLGCKGCPFLRLPSRIPGR